MNVQVRYYTRTGNTERLALAIAEELGVTAQKLDTPLAERADILFLGCSYYAFDMDKCVKDFITANKDRIGTVYCFGTSAMMRSMKKPMRKVTSPLGIALADREFHCRGRFKFANKGRPNEDDLAAARRFAREAVGDNE